MTKKDAAQLVAIVVTAYPNFDKFRDEESIKATVNLWAMMFEDADAKLMALAVKKHIAISKWPPSVAELREILLEITRPDLIPPDMAWLAVSDLLCCTGEYNYGDLKTQLPPLVARAVESIGWTSLYQMRRCAHIGSKPGMDRLTFMRQYEPMYNREKARNITPKALTQQIDQAASQLPGDGRRLLAAREQARRDQAKKYDNLLRRYWQHLPDAADPLALKVGKEALE